MLGCCTTEPGADDRPPFVIPGLRQADIPMLVHVKVRHCCHAWR